MFKRKIFAQQEKLNLIARTFFNHSSKAKVQALTLKDRYFLYQLHRSYKRQALALLYAYIGQKEPWYSLVNFDSYIKAYDNIIKNKKYFEIVEKINKVPYLYDIFEPMLEISRIMREIRKENKYFDIQKDLVQNIYLPSIKRIIEDGLVFRIP